MCECYNPVSETWMRLPDMHHRRAYLGLTALEGNLYAVGEEKIETSLEEAVILLASATDLELLLGPEAGTL